MKSNNSPFQAMKRHNATYHTLRYRDEVRTDRNEEQLERLAHNAERLGSMIRSGAPKGTIRHLAAQIRHDAERLGVMIHIPA